MNPRIPLVSPPRLLALGVAALALTTACDPEPSATVQGSVTDDSGTQTARLAGQGTVETAERVRASAIHSDGETTFLAAGEIDAEGRYHFDVPAGEGPVLLEALDAEGEVVAAALLEATGEAGGEVTATPIDTESSGEAVVYVAAEAPGQVRLGDLRARIDGAVAEAVHEVEETEGSASAEIEALATAVLAAQEAEAQAWAEMGVSFSHDTVAEAELTASQTLSAALDAGVDPMEAHDAFFDALADIRAEHGLTEPEQSEGESQASMAFRLSLEANVDSEEVLFTASRAAASLEARATAEAVAALMAGAEVSSEAWEAGMEAATALAAEVTAAASLEALVEAYADFEAEIVGETEVSGSVLDQALDLDVGAEATAEATIQAALAAAVGLDAALDAGMEALVEAGDEADPEAVATLVVEAWAAYRAEVEQAVDVASELPPTVTVGLLVEATGSFSGGTSH